MDPTQLYCPIVYEYVLLSLSYVQWGRRASGGP